MQELKSWGIRKLAHRRKILANKDNVIITAPVPSLSTQSSVEHDGVELDGGSPPLFPSQSPPNYPQVMRQTSTGSGTSGSQLSHASTNHLSQGSNNSTTQFASQSFEIVQIQLKKKISGSSSGSSQ